jgi:DNA-binding NtrC family response regulator
MPASTSENEPLVNLAALGEFLQALEGKRRMSEVPQGIRLEVALRALGQGMSLAEILRQAVCQLEKGLILRALEATRGNKAAAARLLKIDYKTLYRKIRKYVI